MTCEEAFDFLAAFLDGELPDDTRLAFERHLAMCPPCVAYLDSYRETIALGRAACGSEAAEEVPEELVNAILAARERSS